MAFAVAAGRACARTALVSLVVVAGAGACLAQSDPATGLPKGLIPLEAPSAKQPSALEPLATPKAPAVKAPAATPAAPNTPQPKAPGTATAPAPVAPTTPQVATPDVAGPAVPLKPATPAIVKPGDKVSTLPEKLSGEEIKTGWFDGRPFTSTSPEGAAFKLVFTADGKSTRTPIGKKGSVTHGFWRVIAEGYCSRWTGSPREKCFNVRTDTAGVTTVRFGNQIVATWTR